MTYKFEHTIQPQVSREFAWLFWTNTDNWLFDPSVESVRLNGPFAAGTKGTTKVRDLDPIEWQLTEVEDGSRAVIEIAVAGANLSFDWSYEDSMSGGTQITQRVTLEGEQADDYAEIMRELEQGIPQGMQRLAEEMIRSAGQAKA